MDHFDYLEIAYGLSKENLIVQGLSHEKLNVDTSMLEAICENLIRNAAREINEQENGYLKMEVKCQEETIKAMRVKFTFTDSGGGFRGKDNLRRNFKILLSLTFFQEKTVLELSITASVYRIQISLLRPLEENYFLPVLQIKVLYLSLLWILHGLRQIPSPYLFNFLNALILSKCL